MANLGWHLNRSTIRWHALETSLVVLDMRFVGGGRFIFLCRASEKMRCDMSKKDMARVVGVLSDEKERCGCQKQGCNTSRTLKIMNIRIRTSEKQFKELYDHSNYFC